MAAEELQRICEYIIAEDCNLDKCIFCEGSVWYGWRLFTAGSDMTGLDEKFKTMIGEQLDIQGKRKPVERRSNPMHWMGLMNCPSRPLNADF